MKKVNFFALLYQAYILCCLYQVYHSENELDSVYMKQAIEQAIQAQGKTRPNPCVGCVILDSNGDLVGRGYHKKSGYPHAEIEALKEAGEKAKGGTAYISLEPCNHYGKTPPCTLALLK